MQRSQGFLERVGKIPYLGLGVSTEYGAFEVPQSLDVLRLARDYPQFAQFLELGVEVSKGLDGLARDWLATERPVTYHFLDINLDEPEDFDDKWLDQLRQLVQQSRPVYLCGDAGLWHIGRRDRGHMLLLPPVLTPDSAEKLAQGIVRLRSELGLEVIPENPPGSVFVGTMHLLDFFAMVLEKADTGMLLDCAHLAIYQHAMGLDPLSGLDRFPLERLVELHVAGGVVQERDGYRWIEDTHTPEVLDATWKITEYVLAHAPHIKAVIFECERNPLEDCLPGLGRISQLLQQQPKPRPAGVRPVVPKKKLNSRRIQQVVAGMLHDPVLVEQVYAGKRVVGLEKVEQSLIQSVDRRAFGTDAHRRARVLHALIEEYPVSVAIIGVDVADMFLSSADFHAVLASRGMLGMAFGAWLEPRVGALARLEHALSGARRGLERPGGGFRRAPGVEVVGLPAGTLQVWLAGREALGESPAVAVIQGQRLSAQPLAGGSTEWVLVQESGMEELPEELGKLLVFLQKPRSKGQVLAELRRLGSAGAEEDILLGLLEDKLVVA